MAGDAECEASCVGLALAVCAYVNWVHTFAKCTKHDAKLKVAIELCMIHHISHIESRRLLKLEKLIVGGAHLVRGDYVLL